MNEAQSFVYKDVEYRKSATGYFRVKKTGIIEKIYPRKYTEALKGYIDSLCEALPSYVSSHADAIMTSLIIGRKAVIIFKIDIKDMNTPIWSGLEEKYNAIFNFRWEKTQKSIRQNYSCEICGRLSPIFAIGMYAYAECTVKRIPRGRSIDTGIVARDRVKNLYHEKNLTCKTTDLCTIPSELQWSSPRYFIASDKVADVNSWKDILSLLGRNLYLRKKARLKNLCNISFPDFPLGNSLKKSRKGMLSPVCFGPDVWVDVARPQDELIKMIFRLPDLCGVSANHFRILYDVLDVESIINPADVRISAEDISCSGTFVCANGPLPLLKITVCLFCLHIILLRKNYVK